MGVITFYWNPLSPPAKVVWSVLEALEIPYEKRYIDLVKTRENLKPEYLAINPEGTVPYIVDGDFGIGESRAIICYLCSKYEDESKENKLYPKEIHSKAKVDVALYQDFQHYCNLFEYFNVHGVLFDGETGPVDSKWPALENSYERMERRLKSQRYLAGDYITVADYAALCVTGEIEYMVPEINEERYSRLFEWKKEMESLPCYKECYGDSMKTYDVMYKQMIAANKKK